MTTLEQMLENRENKVFDVDRTYTMIVKKDRYCIFGNKKDLSDPKRYFAGKIMSFESLGAIVHNYQKLNQELYEAFILNYIANTMQNNNIKELQITFDSSIFLTGCLGYCSYKNTPAKVFFSPEVIFKLKTIRPIFVSLNVIEHELAHVKDFEETPITYQKFDNEGGRYAEVSNRHIFDCLYNAMREASPSVANKLKTCSANRYSASLEETFARERALARNKELLRIIETAQKIKPILTTTSISNANRYISQQEENEKQTKATAQKCEKDWDEIRKEVEVIISEYCDLKPENKYIKTSKQHSQITRNLGYVMLALNTNELASQQNFDKLFEYFSSGEIEQDDILMFYLIVGSRKNERSQEMIENFFSKLSFLKQKQVMRDLKEISELVQDDEYSGYPKVAIKHFKRNKFAFQSKSL